MRGDKKSTGLFTLVLSRYSQNQPQQANTGQSDSQSVIAIEFLSEGLPPSSQ